MSDPNAVRNPETSALPRKPLASRRKAEIVLRIMRGEDAHEVASALGLPVHEVESWRKEFVLAGERRMGELPLGLVERCLSPFERLVPLATLISVAIAVAIFVQGQQRDHAARDKDAARAREQQVTDSFNALDDKYVEYVKLCLQHPDLDVFDTPVPRASPPTAQQQRQEAMMFAILLSVLERSFLMYRDPTDSFKREEWRAWEVYIDRWLGRANFVAEWRRTQDEYGSSFRTYMNGLLARRAVMSTQPSTDPSFSRG